MDDMFQEEILLIEEEINMAAESIQSSLIGMNFALEMRDFKKAEREAIQARSQSERAKRSCNKLITKIKREGRRVI